MPIGIITGSGTHALPGFADAELVLHETPFGTVEVSRGRFAGADDIEHFYNRIRRHSHLGGMSPEQFEEGQKPR